MRGYYILVGKKTIPAKSLEEWALFFGKDDSRRVALDEFEGVRVSTVFLGIDHGYSDEGEPILFETMVFTDIEGGGDMWRYSTWEQAELGHNEVVSNIKEKLSKAREFSVKKLDKIMDIEK